MRIMDTAYFLNLLTEKQLYTPPHSQKNIMDSSLNQKMGPRDCNHFLREELDSSTKWKVLTEHKGPGVLTRLWITGDPFFGNLEIYIDDDTQPAIVTTVDDFFSGKNFPFIKPLVLDHKDSSGGRVCYLPIPFKKYLKIRSADTTTSFYWHANITLFHKDAPLAPFQLEFDTTTTEALENVCDNWNQHNGLGDFRSYPMAEINLLANKKNTLFECPAEGTIRSLIIDLKDISYDSFKHIQLSMFWDDEATPSVQVPLHHFFIQSTKEKDFSSFFLGRVGTRCICKIPMPYKNAKIYLTNNNEEDLVLGYLIDATDELTHTEQRFHCLYQQADFKYGTIFKCLELNGRGCYFGTHLVTEEVGSQSTPPNFTQEGNEYIYVDDDQDPSWRGTGTEDYFNCGYYYKYGELATPTHGCMDLHTSQKGYTKGFGPATIVNDNNGLVSAYRFHLLDAITFEKQFIFLLEAGCPKKGALADVNGKEDLSYHWTCYWYQDKKSTTIEQKDLSI